MYLKASKFQISISVESCDEKTAENYRNCYVADMRIVSKISKISIPNLIEQIEHLNENCVDICKKRYGLAVPVHRFK